MLELHPFTGEPYYIAIFLVGAYQEVMGSNHNLFGQPNEAHIVIDTDGRYHITRTIPGNRIGDMLNFARYDRNHAFDNIQRRLKERVNNGNLSQETADELMKEYKDDISRYTYLE